MEAMTTDKPTIEKTVKGYNRVYTLQIVPGESVEIFWEQMNPKTKEMELHTNSFSVGDIASYHFYNFHYTGKISKITENTVTITPTHSEGNKRLKWEHFLGLNDDFTVAESNKQRSEWSD